MKYAERAKEIIGLEAAGLEKVKGLMGDQFDCAVELILKSLESGGKIVITGMGKSFHIGQKVSATLSSTGSPAAVLHPAEAMHGDLGVLGEKDVVLTLSYSGASDELLTLLPIIKRRNNTIIALTGVDESPLTEFCDAIIPVQVDGEACPFNLAPTTSTTAMLAVGDALAIVLLEARGFRKEDYAKLHPGGAIGRTLLLRVSDIMRKGDRMASIPTGSKVKDAVLVMTAARSGSVAVLDEESRVIGIFTDGDFRRHFDDIAALSERQIDDVMTKDPITIRESELAVTVLSIFENHNIDDLVVVDDDAKLVGLIDIQDLPKLKIL